MPSINGREYEYADLSVAVFGTVLKGLRGITYKKTQEKELIYGAGNQPKAIQRGNIKLDGTLMCLKSDFDDLNKAALSAGYNDITEVPGKFITITVVYGGTESNAQLQTASLINVEFSEYEDGMKQGDKFKEISMPFLFTKLKVA